MDDHQTLTSLIVQYLPVLVLYGWNLYLHSGHAVNAATLAEVKTGLATTASIVSGLANATANLQGQAAVAAAPDPAIIVKGTSK